MIILALDMSYVTPVAIFVAIAVGLWLAFDTFFNGETRSESRLDQMRRRARGEAEDEDEPPMAGIAKWLTAWGDGRVNVNTASSEVLLTLPEVDEWMVESIMEGRAGIDGEFGTEDDGFSSVDEVLSVTGLGSSFGSRITTDERRFIRVTSIGEVNGVESGIWCIIRQDGNKLVPVFWREEQMQ